MRYGPGWNVLLILIVLDSGPGSARGQCVTERRVAADNALRTWSGKLLILIMLDSGPCYLRSFGGRFFVAFLRWKQGNGVRIRRQPKPSPLGKVARR